MIEARHFVEAARERGFEWYAGVPCSYLTPFINYVLQDPSLHYVSMANEGDAVALIAGVALGGGERGRSRFRATRARHRDDAKLRARKCGQSPDFVDLDLSLAAASDRDMAGPARRCGMSPRSTR